MDVERLLPPDPIRPVWSGSAFLLYFGGGIALLATAALLGILGGDHGDAALVGFAALAAAAALGLALVLQRAGQAVAAGVLATLAVVFAAVLVGAIESLAGILDAELGDDYQPASLLIELAVIGAALAALRRFRAPILVLPAAVAWVAAVADPGSATGWSDAGEVLAILAGVLLVLAAVVADGSGRRPVGTWLHVVGGLAIGGGALSLVGGTGGWLLVGLLSLAFLGASVAFDRSSYAVLGALGLFATATYFIGKWFGVGALVPFGFGFGGSAPEPWQIALAYVVVGLLLLGLGLATSSARVRSRPAVG